MSELRTEFQRMLRLRLDHFREDTTAALATLVTAAVPAELEMQNFELHHEWERDFPIRASAMDRSNNQSYFEPPFYDSVLPDGDALLPQEQFDIDALIDAGLDLDDATVEVVAPWFRECWLAAGGERFPRPAYFEQHDDIKTFDLRTGEWVDSATVWSDE